ncbi:AraC family transcriptional regulator [Muriicola sp. Z0-33]|uniref:AraC family transcriptional regulator n=1 Tax=Muriicola sp. Z0-33 TaxID=2816957 RepID=UPI00223844D6|nr:AraC family transcriptional regulator [Muriicola sp. Z0-33]MCW5515506.1 helix-turn-helix domain-containing protein [Muriicola sp. Z0-33]
MKVQPFKIPKPVHERLVVQTDYSEQFYDKLHQHEEIQISYIVAGTGKLVVADSVHPFKSGDLFVIGQKCPHVYRSAADVAEAHMISIFFTKTSFGEYFFDIPEMEQVQEFFMRSDAGFKLISNTEVACKLIRQIATTDKFSKFLIFLELLRLLSKSEQQVLTGFVYPKKLSVNEGSRMQTVFDFVMNNFQQEITLNTVAAMAFMTPGAFCRFFKLRTNKTFFQFVIELRIEHACLLLGDSSSLSISEIATLSGFSSISNFNRKFKDIKGVTPTAYFNKIGKRAS